MEVELMMMTLMKNDLRAGKGQGAPKTARLCTLSRSKTEASGAVGKVRDHVQRL